MLSQCSNPGCGKSLLYLRNGRVIRTVKYNDNVPEVQHYWLCGECYLHCDFVSLGGVVSCIEEKTRLMSSREQYFVRGIAS